MTTALADLVQMVRWRTDTVSSEFVSDTEIEAFLNASLAELYDILIETYDDYNVASSTSTAGSGDGNNFFSLPADFCKSRGVDRDVNGQWMTLQPYNFQKRNAYTYPLVRVPYGYLDVYYHLQGNSVFIIPAQNSGATYRIWYVPKFSTIAHGGSLPSYMDTNAWHEYAVADVSVKVLQKQDLDASSFMAQKEQLRQRIVSAAKTRDAGPPKRMCDTRGGRINGRGNWGVW